MFYGDLDGLKKINDNYNICPSNTLEIMLNRIDSNFSEFNKSDILPFDISISIGYSVYTANSKLPFDELLQEADTKLYAEKKRKKACFLKDFSRIQ